MSGLEPPARESSGRALERRLYDGVRRLRDLAIAPVAAPLAALGVAPWAVSVAGVAAAACTFFLSAERPVLPLVALGAAVVADAADGAVARRSSRATAAGKRVDQACDAATFAALALGSGVLGLASMRLAAAATVTCTLAVLAALWAASRRDPAGFRACPRAGFWAHVPKLPFAVAYPLVLLGGPRAVAPALTFSAALGTLVAAAYGIYGIGTSALSAAPSPAPGGHTESEP